MNGNSFITVLPSNPTNEQLTYNKNTNFMYNYSSNSAIYCGNLIFNDFSTSKVTEEEQVKYQNCYENMERLHKLLPSILNN